MLLKKGDYQELCQDVPCSKEPYVFAFFLDMADEKRAMAGQNGIAGP